MGKTYRYKKVNSTNDIAREILEDKAVVIAEEQTSGRGRMGRSFYSPKGGIYMSIVVKNTRKMYLSAAASVGVCRALLKYTKYNPKIKWVNDIYIDGKKAGGILVETTGDYAIIGIGLNFNTTLFPKELEDIAASVHALETIKEDIEKEIYTQVLHIVETGQFYDEYVKLSFVIGKEIIVSNNSVKYKRRAKGITDMCALIVEDEYGNTEILSSGEITIRTIPV